MFASAKSWFLGLSKASKVALLSIGVVVGGATELAVANQFIPQSTKNVSHTAHANETRCVSHITSTDTTESVPYISSQTSDAGTTKGQTYTKVVGVNGVKTITTENTTYTPTGCKQNETRISKSEVTTQPVNEVIAVGTYVAPQPTCTNGSYVNSSGNTVCSPSATNTGGATARCNDGSYSYSQHRSGTCSGHKGVAVWY